MRQSRLICHVWSLITTCSIGFKWSQPPKLPLISSNFYIIFTVFSKQNNKKHQKRKQTTSKTIIRTPYCDMIMLNVCSKTAWCDEQKKINVLSVLGDGRRRRSRTFSRQNIGKKRRSNDHRKVKHVVCLLLSILNNSKEWIKWIIYRKLCCCCCNGARWWFRFWNAFLCHLIVVWEGFGRK